MTGLQNVLEIEGLRVSEAKIFRCAGSLRRCAPALARRLRRRAYPDLYVDPRHPGGPVTTPSQGTAWYSPVIVSKCRAHSASCTATVLLRRLTRAILAKSHALTCE